MTHYIPFARSDGNSVEEIVKWLGVDDLLSGLSILPVDQEFSLLLDFLVEFAGSYELALHRMEETLVDQAAISYQANATAVRKVKDRLWCLYSDRSGAEGGRGV